MQRQQVGRIANMRSTANRTISPSRSRTG